MIYCDLQSCIDIAFLTHPSLNAGGAREAGAKATLRLREAERRPTLDFDATSGYFSGEGTGPQASLGGVAERSVSGWYYYGNSILDITIFKEGTFWGQTSNSARQAQFGVAEQEWKTRALHIEVAQKVAEAYIEILKNSKTIKLNQEIVVLKETGYKLALAEFNRELISRNDLLISEVGLATARKDFSLSRVGLQRNQETLSSLLGLDKSYRIIVQDIKDSPVPLPPLEKLLFLARENHPEVKERGFKVLTKQEEVTRIQSGQYPSLSLNVSLSGGDDFNTPIRKNWGAAFKVKVPIFDFGRNNASVAIAQAQATEEEKLLLDFKLTLDKQIIDYYHSIQELDAQAELIQKQIEQAAEALKLNRAMFQQDLLSLSALHESEASLLKLRSDQIKTESDKKLARLRLKFVSGE